MRWLHALFALLFVFSAVLQLNDPDPLVWVAVYLLAAGLTALPAIGRRPAWLRPAALALVAVTLVWAVAIELGQSSLPALGALVEDWEMHGRGIEERRETLGLLIVGLWMAVVARRGAGEGRSGRFR